MIKKREREKLIFQINITPLTDVMLVLLIIFMVTTPFIIQGNIKINLPAAQAPSDDSLDKNIIIGISADGRVYLNGKLTDGGTGLYDALKAEIAQSKNDRVIIEGDKAAMHGSIVKVMGIARNAGAGALAISTIPEKEKIGGQ